MSSSNHNGNNNGDDNDEVVDLCTTEEEGDDDEEDDDDSLGFCPPPPPCTTTATIAVTGDKDNKNQDEDLLLACEYINVFEDEEKKDDSETGNRGEKDDFGFVPDDGIARDDEDFLPACECTNVFDDDDDDETVDEVKDHEENDFLTRDCTSSRRSINASRALPAAAATNTSHSANQSTENSTNTSDKSEIEGVNVIDIDGDSDVTGPKNVQGRNLQSSTTNSTGVGGIKRKTPSDTNTYLALQASIDTNDDAQLAAALQAEENEKEQIKINSDISNDAEIAAKLQEEELNKLNNQKRRKVDEEQSMRDSHSGKAWLFIQKVVQLHQKLKGEYYQQLGPRAQQQLPFPHNIKHEIDTVAIDDMVYTCEKLLEYQEKFRKENHPTEITIGYHYTQKEAMEHIKQHGLLSKPERDGINRSSVSSTLGGVRYNGAAFGDGIYTGNNPHAFKIFGEVGLLVATLRGKTKHVNYYGLHGNGLDDAENNDAHTVIGNKMTSRGLCENNAAFNDEIVLRKSSQCLPLIQYHSSMSSQDVIWTYHVELQKLVDEYFNGGVETKVERIQDPLRNMLCGIGITPPPPLSSTPFFNGFSNSSSLSGGNMFGGSGGVSSGPLSSTASRLAILNNTVGVGGGGPANMTSLGMGNMIVASGGGANSNTLGGNATSLAAALGMTSMSGGATPSDSNSEATAATNNLGMTVADSGGSSMNNALGSSSTASMANILGFSNGMNGSNILPPPNNPLLNAPQSMTPTGGRQLP